MFLNHLMDCEWKGQKLMFRCLHSSDITEEYVSSLNNDSKYIETKSSVVTRESQGNYVSDIERSSDRLICGLFLNGELVGTSGIQKISASCFTIGILLFDQWRGMGLGKDLVWMACTYLADVLNGEVVKAGVKLDNLASLNSFLRCGFKIAQTDEAYYRLELAVPNLRRPPEVVVVSFKDKSM